MATVPSRVFLVMGFVSAYYIILLLTVRERRSFQLQLGLIYLDEDRWCVLLVSDALLPRACLVQDLPLSS